MLESNINAPWIAAEAVLRGMGSVYNAATQETAENHGGPKHENGIRA